MPTPPGRERNIEVEVLDRVEIPDQAMDGIIEDDAEDEEIDEDEDTEEEGDAEPPEDMMAVEEEELRKDAKGLEADRDDVDED